MKTKNTTKQTEVEKDNKNFKVTLRAKNINLTGKEQTLLFNKLKKDIPKYRWITKNKEVNKSFNEYLKTCEDIFFKMGGSEDILTQKPNFKRFKQWTPQH